MKTYEKTNPFYAELNLDWQDYFENSHPFYTHNSRKIPCEDKKQRTEKDNKNIISI